MKEKPEAAHVPMSLLERLEALELECRAAQRAGQEEMKILREAIAAITKELRGLQRLVGK